LKIPLSLPNRRKTCQFYPSYFHLKLASLSHSRLDNLSINSKIIHHSFCKVIQNRQVLQIGNNYRQVSFKFYFLFLTIHILMPYFFSCSKCPSIVAALESIAHVPRSGNARTATNANFHPTTNHTRNLYSSSTSIDISIHQQTTRSTYS
jgi:hypothetical protein